MDGGVSPHEWRALQPLLDLALDLEPRQRRTFVDAACADDGRLRDTLWSLLESCDRADGMLREPAVVAYEPLLADVDLPRLLDGRYRIVREIARGGMGTVYLADDQRHRRPVAVKVLHRQPLAPRAARTGRERFLREIELAARLSHPHVLPLYDSGTVAGPDDDGEALLYYVSPFVSGETLRERMRRAPRPTGAEVVRLGCDLARALEHAHRNGVVHLDVKPENVLLQDGHAIITDFGIAQVMRLQPDPAAAAEPRPILGTPGYVSPEQARGVPDLDGRSDVYSLGCVLYELMAGTRPFHGPESSNSAAAVRRTGLPDRRPLVEHGTPALAAVILRAMAIDREERFPSAGELAAALAEALDDTAAPPAHQVHHSTRFRPPSLAR
jgi:eukaryotic-like serine/threonine-protein kinase